MPQHPVAVSQLKLQHNMSLALPRHLKRPLAKFVQVSDLTLQALIAQLIELSSRGNIRVTESGKYSIYDVIEKVADKGNQWDAWNRLVASNPEVLGNCEDFRFPGQGQRSTPVTDLAGIVEIIWLLPGEFSNKFRQLGAKLVSEAIQSESKEPSQELMQAINNMAQSMAQQSRAIAQLKEQSEETLAIAAEYLHIRKYSDSSMPGLNDLVDEVVASQFKLPPVRVSFTAPQYAARHATELSQRQVSSFCQEAAASYRLLKKNSPPKTTGGVYVYTNEDKILLDTAIATVRLNTPYETKGQKPCLDNQNTPPPQSLFHPTL